MTKIQLDHKSNVDYLIKEFTKSVSSSQQDAQTTKRIIQNLFLKAGDSIEINKRPFNEAFQIGKWFIMRI
jgi:hypothetical protein